MLSPEVFLDFLNSIDIDFFTGVPDSLLQAFCITLYNHYGISSSNHLVAVNEGNAVALAAGYHLATGKTPLVYLQNSGLGNVVNPAISLTDPKVYGIPIVYVIGWRGEPGVHDEPQHIKQGEITCEMLEVMGIPYYIINQDTTMNQIEQYYDEFKPRLERGQSVAFVVRKGSFESPQGSFPTLSALMTREFVIQRITNSLTKNDYVIATTGKISRELFEHRKITHSPHANHDFLTVGSMGHASAIALAISTNHPDKRIWCLDGDGATLMHMGSLALIGSVKPKNFFHIVLNNASHESVGGMPTVATSVDLCGIAKACGYPNTLRVKNEEELHKLLSTFNDSLSPTFVEVVVSSGSRGDLIRPDTTPAHNKEQFMRSLKGEK
jgi:phosphonopyruvate decarboxylase